MRVIFFDIDEVLNHRAQDQCSGCGGKAEVDYQEPPNFDYWRCPRCGDLEWRLALWHDTPTQALFPVSAPTALTGVLVAVPGNGYRDVRYLPATLPAKPRRSLRRWVGVGVAIGLTVATYLLTR